jgi:2-phospho-L-lactate/phosphoenolpyruvate guanylyltransferase
MTPWIVLPIKDPARAKSRLAPAVPAADRRAAALTLAERTLSVLAATGEVAVVVVTRGAPIARLAARFGFPVIVEAGDTHSAAARQGAAWAATQGADVVVALAADLPLLAPADVRAILRRAGPDRAVIAPDRLGLGTNAVAAPPTFPFTFGAPSFARHVSLARAADLAVVVLRTPGLAVDLDTPWDMDLLGRSWHGGRAELKSQGRTRVS